jgi:hypothetical protein
MIHKYVWKLNGRDITRACSCGGTLRGHSVDPPRSALYANHIWICDNPDCQAQVIHEGTKRERRGRFILR